METVTPSQQTMSIKVGDADRALSFTTAPENATNKALDITSSDPTVATYVSGKVHALKAGKTDIVATAQDGSGVSGKCAVTVSAADVAVTGVTIAPKTASIAVGATQQLTPTVAPSNATNKQVTYSSNKESIATVNASGLVTAKAEGEATITVTTADGAKTDTSVITVTTPTVAVTGVTIAPKTASVKVGETQQLTPNVAPENATNKEVTYSSSDDTKASVSASGLVTGVAEGEATITVRTSDGAKTDSSVITVTAAEG